MKSRDVRESLSIEVSQNSQVVSERWGRAAVGQRLPQENDMYIVERNNAVAARTIAGED
jgi:transcriptional regulator of met regulon